LLLAAHVPSSALEQHSAMQAVKELARTKKQGEALHQAKTDIAWELQELSSASRCVVKSLMLTNEDLDRRTHDLSQQLLAAVPVRAYSLLLEKYNAMLAHRRDAFVDQNQVLLASEEVKGDLERQMASLEQRYVAACSRAAAAEEDRRMSEKVLSNAGIAVPSELAGDLRQRAVELETCRLQSAEAGRKADRMKEDLQERGSQLARVREEFACQAKRASPRSSGMSMSKSSQQFVCMREWHHGVLCLSQYLKQLFVPCPRAQAISKGMIGEWCMNPNTRVWVFRASLGYFMQHGLHVFNVISFIPSTFKQWHPL
jgi:hypothetical protein